MDLLVLDFDGVLSDSAPEAFEVARRTLARLRPDASLAGRDPEALYREFVALMPLGNRAEDFGVALAALAQGCALADQTAWDAFFAAQDADFLAAFHEHFYRERAAFAAEEPRRWRSLLGPYPDFVALLRRRARDRDLAIATAKDRPTVECLLADYGVADLFPPERVLDKGAGRSKAAHLAALRERLALPYARMTFVDDKVNHLDAVAPLGVRCALAAWGYNGEREWKLARSRGYAVCTLAEAEARLFDG